MHTEKTILIVDDEQSEIDILYHLLNQLKEDETYDIVVASNGEDALKAVNNRKVNLILLDIMMPGIDGYEVCKRLKADDSTKEIPVIFVTSLVDNESIKRGYDVGGSDYITKPVKPQELFSRIKKEFAYKTVKNIFSQNSDQKIIIEYEGILDQSHITEFDEKIEENIENIGFVSNILTIMVEQCQNIIHYSKNVDNDSEELTSEGFVSFIETNQKYIFNTKNILSQKDKEKIVPKLEEILSLDRQEIRKRYKELRRTGENAHTKGGGIGLYEIAKRCNTMEYYFEKINENKYIFSLSSIINKVNF